MSGRTTQNHARKAEVSVKTGFSRGYGCARHGFRRVCCSVCCSEHGHGGGVAIRVDPSGSVQDVGGSL